MVERKSLEFGLLGPLLVTGPSGPVTVRGPRLRALLVRLLIEANTPVAASQLVHDIWEGSPPPTAPATLQTYVSRLRQSLGSERIRNRHRGYLVEAGPDELDSMMFERELRHGSALLAGGDAAAAAPVLDRAVQRWRGEALADGAGAVWAVAEVTRLTELQGHAWEQWCGAQLALGQHQQVVAAAEAALARDALRETMWRHLMLALYRSGRQADALRAFRRLREALAELGLEPGREAQALEDAILLQKPELDWTGPAPAIGAPTIGAPASSAPFMGSPGAPAATPILDRRAPAPVAPAPVPVAVGMARRGSFVGRRNELSHLADAWALTAEGRGRVVALAGEAGIGKTRLVAEFANQLSLGDSLILWGRCDEEGSPYQPFAEMLAGYLGSCPPATLSEVLAGDGPEMVRLVPSLLERLPDLTPEAIVDLEGNRDRLLNAVTGVLRRTTDQRRVLMVVDDLHWAPRDTLTLLRHLAYRLSASPLLIIVTYRDTDIPNDHPWHDLRADLAIQDMVELVHVNGLGTDAVRELAGETLAGGAGDAAADLQARTGGNPFFCLQLVRHTGESAAGAGPPAGVRDVVRQRVDRLGPQARHVLQVAAIAGMEFDGGLLEELATGPTRPDDLVPALEKAVAARLLDEVPDRPGQFRFVHALVQETLQAGMSAMRRAALHRRIAEVLAARRQPATVVAQHMVLGASVDTAPAAVPWLRRAAAELVAALAFDDAVDTLHRALKLLETWSPRDHEARACVHLTLAFFLGVLGDSAGQKSHAALAAWDARAAGTVEMLVDAAIERATWTEAGSLDPVARELLDEALAAVRRADPGLTATLLAVSALHRGLAEGGSIEMDPIAVQAEDLARDQGDPALLFEVLHFRAVLLQGSPALEEQRRIVAEMERIESEMGAALWETPSTHWGRMKLLLGVRDFRGWWDITGLLRFRAVVGIQGGDIASFDHDLMDATRSWSARSQSMGATLSMWRGLRALLDGRFDEAARHADAMLETAGEDRNFVNSWAAMQFQLARERGDLAALRPLIESAIAENPGLPGFRTALAVLLTDEGDLDGAGSIVESLGPDLSGLQAAVAASAVMAQLAEVVGRLGDRSRAEQLGGMLRPYRGQLIVVTWGVSVLGAADRFLAILSDTSGHRREADDLFVRALSLEESVGSDPLATRTRLAWARCRMTRGRPADLAAAADLLGRAAQDAARLGMAGVVDEISSLQSSLRR